MTLFRRDEPPLGTSEAADLIARFLHGQELYPVEPRVEPYRTRCYDLDPLVNRPGSPDLEALKELKDIADKLRKI